MSGNNSSQPYHSGDSYPSSSSNNNNNNNNNNSSSSNDGMGGAFQFAQAVFTKENIAKAGKVAKEKAIELKTQAQDGDHSLRILAYLGGMILVVVASMEVVGKLASFNIVGALISLYTLLLGILIIILEGKNTFLPSDWINRIHKYALFLKFLWGRGSLYFICGTIELYQFDFWSLISGGYMCIVGILYILVGNKTANKLRSLRKSLYTAEALHTMFAQADVDGDGALDLHEFRNLTISLGLDMTRRETEAAFTHIQEKTDSEKLTFEEFRAWWNETDAGDDVDENAFVFV